MIGVVGVGVDLRRFKNDINWPTVVFVYLQDITTNGNAVITIEY